MPKLRSKGLDYRTSTSIGGACWSNSKTAPSIPALIGKQRSRIVEAFAASEDSLMLISEATDFDSSKRVTINENQVFCETPAEVSAGPTSVVNAAE